MRLSWNEIRARAAQFSDEWKNAHYEKGETQSFYNAFFRIFGIDRKRVATYEHAVEKLGGNRGFIDLFWPGTLIVEQKSKGRDLFKAKEQALDYTHTLADSEMPRFILVSDFQTFELTDLDTRQVWAFSLADLKENVRRFDFILGRQIRQFKDQDPVNIKAAELVGVLHDELKAAGYDGHRLEQFLVRIVFCLFADDTGIFEPKDMLWDWLENRTRPDGTDTGPLLNKLFDVLNTPEDARSPNLDADLAKFPYVNGELFNDYFPAPDFNADMRAALVNACRFDWTPISPAIFGSLFQSVMDAKERRALGAHYTTEMNIQKVIGPLFMDDLRSEFDHLKGLKTGRRQRLNAFHDRLAKLTFFDPACGCGNFLIIAYRELRLLEHEILHVLYDKRQRELDVDILSRIDVDQFYGIEIGEFPARIAQTALWMMDHLMNRRLSDEFGQVFLRIPLQKSPTIVHGDALEIDWAEVLAPEKCSYVFGNPPFVGKKEQSTVQKMQVARIAKECKNPKILDYVSSWFVLAAGYVQGKTRVSFVATNSITQGEQVAQLWPLLFDRFGLEIAFAHRTFAWGSEARGKAHVHVVILGLERRENMRGEKRLFSYPDVKGDPVETRHAQLSPYLFDASRLADPHLVITSSSSPMNELRPIKTGVQMIDNGILTFDKNEKELLLTQQPNAEIYFRKYVGSDEYINGFVRWILYLRDATPNDLRQMPKIKELVAKVRSYRAESRRPSTQKMADYPTLVGVDERLSADFLVIPNTSSERREYVPIGWMTPDYIANQNLRILPEATLAEFGLLTSSMHMGWMRYIGGRLKSDFRYSIGLVYNTFPLPRGDLSKLAPLAQAILDARAEHPDATLADLYDPDLMPPNLRRAHNANDKAVDRLYRRSGFDSDRARVEHLFALYEKMVKPLLAKGPKRRRR